MWFPVVIWRSTGSPSMMFTLRRSVSPCAHTRIATADLHILKEVGTPMLAVECLKIQVCTGSAMRSLHCAPAKARAHTAKGHSLWRSYCGSSQGVSCTRSSRRCGLRRGSGGSSCPWWSHDVDRYYQQMGGVPRVRQRLRVGRSRAEGRGRAVRGQLPRGALYVELEPKTGRRPNSSQEGAGGKHWQGPG